MLVTITTLGDSVGVLMPYLIADECFPTKDAIIARCREVLVATSDGEFVDEDVVPFLLELFQFHDEWYQKANGGIVHITTQTTSHGTRCFVLVKQTGDRVDISFPHAVRLVPTVRSDTLLPQTFRDFRNAARVAVKVHIFEFRDSALRRTQRCPLTGKILSRATCAVDHIAPQTFDQLLFDFCHSHSLNPLTVVVSSKDGTVPILEDRELLVAWQEYHRDNARLRLISRIGNLQLPKNSVAWSELWS